MAVEAELATLLQSAEKRWKKIKGFKQLELVLNNVQFRDGEAIIDQLDG